MKKHLEMIKFICMRPGMYVGSNSYKDVINYIKGYLNALDVEGKPQDDGWREWVSLKYNIWSTAWSWDRMILHKLKSEEEAIKLLPNLFQEFFNDIETIGKDKIIEKHKLHFSSGERIPNYTNTLNPS